MSFSTPILTVGAPCARGRTSGKAAAAVTEPRSVRREMVMASNPLSGCHCEEWRDDRNEGGLNPQILMQLVHVGLQPVVRDHVDHLAVLHHVMPVCHRL